MKPVHSSLSFTQSPLRIGSLWRWVRCFVFAALAPLASAAPALECARQSPNILFIFSDDHTTQAVSAYGEKEKLISPAL